MFLAWPCGRPLDLQCGWDAASRAGTAQVKLDLQAEDPYCAVFSHPCGPWSMWSVINISKGGAARETVLRAREFPRGILKQVNRIVTGRVAVGRHVLLEHPADSLSCEQPEMAGIAKLLEEGKFFYIRRDGCSGLLQRRQRSSAQEARWHCHSHDVCAVGLCGPQAPGVCSAPAT